MNFNDYVVHEEVERIKVNDIIIQCTGLERLPWDSSSKGDREGTWWAILLVLSKQTVIEQKAV